MKERAIDIDLQAALDAVGVRMPVHLAVLNTEAEVRHAASAVGFVSTANGQFFPGRFGHLVFLNMPRVIERGIDPGEVVLHELVHARQCEANPEMENVAAIELFLYGYDRAPHEVEARRVARELVDAGVRVVR